jgi:hypothetical protein
MELNATSGICGIEGSMGRAFSPRIRATAVHGASPHAGIGRAFGASKAARRGSEMEGRVVVI